MNILIRSLLSNESVHVLLVGSQGAAKTLFLTEIMRSFRSCLFVAGSNTTKAGSSKSTVQRRAKVFVN